MQIRDAHKLLRAHSGAYLLPAVAADFLAAMQGATAKQLQQWKVPRYLDVPSLVVGGSFLLAPVGLQTLSQIHAVLQGTQNQKV
jgi:hypothetical protein